MKFDKRGKRSPVGAIVIALVTVVALVALMMPVNTVAQALETKAFVDTNIFTVDGHISHYYIERENSSLPANVTIYHPENSLILYINTTNVKELWIDCESLYADEKDTVWYDPVPAFQTWIPGNPVYVVYLKTDGNLSDVAWFNDGALDPLELRWDDTVISYSNNATWLSASVPAHSDGVTYTIEIFYQLEVFYIMEGLATLLVILGIMLLVVRWVRGSFYSLEGDDWGKLW